MMMRRFSLLLRKNNTLSTPKPSLISLSRSFDCCLNGLNLRNRVSLVRTPFGHSNQFNTLSSSRSVSTLFFSPHIPLRFVQKRTYCSTNELDEESVDELVDESDSSNQRVVLPNTIHEAVFDGDLDKMKEFVKNGVDINTTTRGLSPFEIAIKQGHIHIVKELILQMGVDVNSLPDSETTPLFVAIENNQLEIFKLLIENKADPYLPNKEGYLTPIDSAIIHNNTEMIKLLQEHITPEILNYPQKTPFHMAALVGNLKLVKFCVERGANIELADFHDRTALHYAALTHQLEVAQYLISLGMSVDKIDNEGYTPLHLAVSEFAYAVLKEAILKSLPKVKFESIEPNYISKRFELIKLLLQHGANPNNQNLLQQTPIIEVITKGNLNVIKELVKHGADVQAAENNGGCLLHRAGHENLEPEIAEYLLSLGLNVNGCKQKEDLTPLHVAAHYGNLETLKVLLKHGAQVDAITTHKETPLFVAVLNNQLETAQALLENGANVDYTNDQNETPLHTAVYDKNLEIVKLLLRYKANATLCNTHEFSPLHIAIHEGSVEIVKELVDYGVNIHQIIYDSKNALHLAASHNHIEVVKYMISIGMDVNTPAEHPLLVTPIYFSVLHLNQEMAKLLLQHNANPNVLDGFKNAPLHIAVFFGDLEMTKLLLQHNADVNIPNVNGETPLHLAAETGDLEMVQLLLQYKANLNIKTNTVVFRGGGKNGPVKWIVGTTGTMEKLQALKKKRNLLKNQDINNKPDKEKTPGESDPKRSTENAGITPLHNASQREYKEIVDLLLQNGADVNIRTTERDLALHFASQKGNIKIVEQLLKIAPNQIDQKGKKGFTALHYAISNNHLELTLWLLKKGAVMNAMNDDGKTPFELFPSEEFEKAVINYFNSSASNK